MKSSHYYVLNKDDQRFFSSQSSKKDTRLKVIHVDGDCYRLSARDNELD